jgi:ammonium transporter, Amt family
MFLDRIITVTKEGDISFDLIMAMKGCLEGIVATTAGCAVVAPWTAVIIGMIAGGFNNVGSKTLIYFKIDDAVDALPIHLGNGIWGIIAVGLFAESSRLTLAYSDNSTHVG